MTVEIMDGMNGTKTYKLEDFGKDVISFGRSSENDIVLSSGKVSRNHGCFYMQNQAWFIQDLGSSCGIFCNGESVMARVLTDGAEFYIPGQAGTKEMIIRCRLKDAAPVQSLRREIGAQKLQKQQSRKREKYSEQEYTITELTGGYASNFLHGAGAVTNTATLTNKRYRFSGTCYTSAGAGTRFMKDKQQWTIDLEDITATGFVYRSMISWLILSVLCGIAGVVLAQRALSGVSEYAGVMMTQQLLSVVSKYAVIPFIFGIVFLVVYLISKRTYFVVSHAGGSVALLVTQFGGYEAVKSFDNILREHMDLAKEIRQTKVQSCA